jgi:hypothetical protein
MGQEQDVCKDGRPAPPLPADIVGHVNEPPISAKLVKSPKLNTEFNIKGLRLGMGMSDVRMLTNSSPLIQNGGEPIIPGGSANVGARIGWYNGPDCLAPADDGYQRCNLRGSCTGAIQVSPLAEARGLGGVRCDESIYFWLSPGEKNDKSRRIVAIAYTEGGQFRVTHLVEVDPHHVKRVDAKSPDELIAQLRNKFGNEAWRSYTFYPDACHWVYSATWFSAETYKTKGYIVPKYQLKAMNGTLVFWDRRATDFDSDNLTEIHKLN